MRGTGFVVREWHGSGRVPVAAKKEKFPPNSVNGSPWSLSSMNCSEIRTLKFASRSMGTGVVPFFVHAGIFFSSREENSVKGKRLKASPRVLHAVPMPKEASFTTGRDMNRPETPFLFSATRSLT